MKCKLYYIRRSLLLMVLAMVSLPGMSLTEPGIFESHDFTQQDDGSFIVSGNDAYVVLPIDNSSVIEDAQLEPKKIDTQDNAQQLSFKISFIAERENVSTEIEAQAKGSETVPVELFYNPAFKIKETGEKSPVFDPFTRIKFVIPKVSQQHVMLQLPADLQIDRTLIRIDIDQCLQCKLQFGPHVLLGKPNISSTAQNTTTIDQIELYRGLQSIPKQGLSLDVNSWLLNDLEKFEDAHLEASGIDPFLVSPKLDNDISQLGGVYLDIDIPNTHVNVVDLQLFYATEHHDFIESASSLVRLAPDAEAKNPVDISSGRKRFFVPLELLAKQARPARLLKRLRLDFANVTNSSSTKLSNNSPKWRVNEIKLVNSSQVEMFAALVPPQLLHTIKQSNSHRQILSNIFKKIFSDIWFVVFYTFLLMGVMITIIRKFRTATDSG